jgi:hypothetical protein
MPTTREPHVRLSLRNPASSTMSEWARSRRWEMLLARFPHLTEMSVLDLGGTTHSWEIAPRRPRKLVLVNRPDANTPDRRGVVLADACDQSLLDGEHFDLVFSNSVIEHVGGHYRRDLFARNVYRLGEHHWIQTPYRFFPIEPHWLAPGIQFFPTVARAWLTKWWPLGNFGAHRDVDDRAVEWALGIELLSKASMRHYFPSSELLIERVGWLPKSLIAVR